ncbi:MAG: tetraacyldisaccharide 4'-kinase [Elusimicrobia bacterium]|nr:tetraacyldisaccharide 4'-kinase [Elusimicrobiota bacterium]
MFKYLLYPFSIIYYFLSELNRTLTKPKKLYKPVISVGNITWGGSGKTPMTIEVAEYILSLGKTPVILSRGYARKNQAVKNVVVRDKEKILSDISDSGDEPYMMACRVDCPVIVGADRIESAELARQFNPDVFILDDGFQHWKLQRDLDIVCINSLNPFGNGMTIPSGILREKKSALKRANLIALTNCDLVSKDTLNIIKQEVFNIKKEIPLEVSCKNYYVVNMFDNVKIEDLTLLKEQISFVVVSAIGSPDNFVNTVKNLGLKIKDKVFFSDHHKYKSKDITDILNFLDDNEKIITTAKDAVKINEVTDMDMKEKIYVLNVSLSFESGKEKFEKEIKSLLGVNNEK